MIKKIVTQFPTDRTERGRKRMEVLTAAQKWVDQGAHDVLYLGFDSVNEATNAQYSLVSAQRRSVLPPDLEIARRKEKLFVRKKED